MYKYLFLLCGLFLTQAACGKDVELILLQNMYGKVHRASTYWNAVLYQGGIISSSGKEIIRRELDSDKEEIIFRQEDVYIIDNMRNIFLFIDNYFNLILFDIEKREVLKRGNYLDDFNLDDFDEEFMEPNYLLHKAHIMDENRLIMHLYNRHIGKQEVIVYDHIKKERNSLGESVSFHILDVYRDKKMVLFEEDAGENGYTAFIYHYDTETVKEIGQFESGLGSSFLYTEDSLIYSKPTIKEKKYTYYSLIKLDFGSRNPSEKIINNKDHIALFRYYRNEGKMIASLRDPKKDESETVLYEVK